MRPALCEDAQRLGPRARRPRAERARGARPARADGDPGVAIGGARRTEGRADPAARSGSAAMESAADPARPHRARARGAFAAASADRTRCRRRSPRAMPARGRRIRPTGSGSRRSTTSSRRSCRRRSSSSIARSRTGWRSGPSKGLEVVEPLVGNPALSEYPYLPGVRADLLFKLKRFDEAKVEFEKAAALTKNASQRALLLQKAALTAQAIDLTEPRTLRDRTCHGRAP